MFDIIQQHLFDNLSTGTYTSKNNDWNINTNGFTGYDNRPSQPVIIEFGEVGNKVARNFYPAGGWGPSGSGSDFGGGIPIQEEIYFQWRWRYDPNWAWTRGNKFPGIRMHPTMGAANNGDPNGNGCTFRFQLNSTGLIRWYVYHYNATTIYGDSLGWNGYQLQRGVWHHVIMRVVLNTIGVDNGVLQVWIDGELRNTQTNMRFRDNTTNEVSRFMNRTSVSTFMGGSDSSYAPNQDQYTWMDDFYLWKYTDAYLTANPSVPRGSQVWTAQQTLLDPYTESLGGSPPPDPNDSNPNPPPSFSTRLYGKVSFTDTPPPV